MLKRCSESLSYKSTELCEQMLEWHPEPFPLVFGNVALQPLMTVVHRNKYSGGQRSDFFKRKL